MKKKNLNFLLIALAALALVFAGACSDGSDDSDGTSANNGGTPTDTTNYAASYYGTEWKYEETLSLTSDGSGLSSITLTFGEDAAAGVAVAIDGSTRDSGTSYEWADAGVTIPGCAFTATASTVTITLPADSNSGGSNSSAVALTLTLGTKENDDTTPTLAVSSVPNEASYTISATYNSNKTASVDIFSSGVANCISTTTVFEKQEEVTE